MIPVVPVKSAPASGVNGCPYSGSQCSGSYNWGGYVVYNSAYTVSKVSASWKVPTITGASGTICPDTQTTWDSNSVWIGIDGYSSGTVEQTGTSADCYYGTISYYAWYEFYPSGSVVVFSVNPGDSIKATVSYTGTSGGTPQFKTTITDSTTSSTTTSPTTGVTGALRNSAEWIDESPYYNGYLGLTQVGSIKFTSATATIGGTSGSISSWGSNVYWVLMVDYNFPYSSTLSYAKAQPTALTSGGKTFSMKWLSNGP
jgi:Peptidase A4 family